jgi:hypothetical protein
MDLSRRWGWIGFIAILAILFLLSLIFGLLNVHPWANVTAERIAGYHKEQCEFVNPSAFFLQFHNFWSNAAYLAVGALIIFLSDVWTGWVIGGALVFLGLTSGWFHGTLTETGQTFDMIGVYVVLLGLLAYIFIEMVPLNYDDPKAFVIMFAALGVAVIGGLVRTKVRFFDSDYFTPLLVFILIVYMIAGGLRYLPKPNAPSVPPGDGLLLPLFLALISGLIAVLFKFSDGDDNAVLAQHGGNYTKCLYEPHSLIQGHALWHLTSAIMFLGVFEFSRSLLARSNSVFPWRPSRPDKSV